MQNKVTDSKVRKSKMNETFESSMQEKKIQKFSMNKTLYQGIKQNNVSKIIDIGKDGGNVDENELSNEQGELQLMVVQMRKKYDEVKTQTKATEIQIDKNRKLIQILKQEEGKLSNHISTAKSNLSSKQNEFKVLFDSLEAKIYDLDIYKQMEQTLKHDIILFRKRNFDKDLDFKKQGVKLKSLKNEEFTKTRLSYRCKDMLQSVQKTVNHKQFERNTKINSFYDVLNRKYTTIKRQELRQKEIQEVMMKAMSQKLQQEKQWIKICQVNLFLKRMLKAKMERLIQKNNEIESAFHKIKISTDVTDSKDLINRFLNREKHYGDLLESISTKENILTKLRDEQANLSQTNLQLTQQLQQLNEQSIRNTRVSEDQIKILQKLESSLKKIQEQKELMHKWATRFMCNLTKKNRESFSEKETQSLLIEALKQTNKYLDSVIGQENNAESINRAFLEIKPMNQIFDEDMKIRNNRLKTYSAHDENTYDGEQKQGNYDDISEADYLHLNRRAVKKNDLSRRFRIKTKPN